MKKLLLVLLLTCTFVTFAQTDGKFPQDVNKKQEIKLNVLTLIAAKWIDVSYENLINEESSFGISATINTDTSETDLNYQITPFYRRYFSNKFARGFFVEGFGSLFSARKYSNLFISSNEFETGFALGVSVGGKFVSKKGFSTELLLGVGRNLAGDTDYEGIGRIAISVGYRF